MIQTGVSMQSRCVNYREIQLLLRCAQSVEKVEKDTDRNYWIPAKDAIAYGLISRIVETHDDI